jgi:hypothetical protein
MSTMVKLYSKLHPFFLMLFDLLSPIFTYYILHLAGFRDFAALTAGGFVSGINAAVDVVRNRQAKSISILILILFVLSIALVFATQDARILLIKPSIFIAAAGVYVVFSTFSRPILLDGMEPFATHGNPEKKEKWKSAWRDSKPFQRRVQIATLLSGLLLLLEAAARVIIVFALPVDVSVIVSNLPGVLLIVFFALIGRFYLKGAAEQAMGEGDE